MIWFVRFFKILIFFQIVTRLCAFAQDFVETYGPVIVDDLPFESVRISLHEGIVRGRKVSLFDKEIEVYRGLLQNVKLILIFFIN